MKQLSGVRKADTRLGDDATYTRWIRIRRHGHKTKSRQPALMPADAVGTKFPSRVMQVDDMNAVLVSGHSNVKIGRDVRVGKLRGYWLYTLSLQERTTCPKTCVHWRDCYGNNMPYGKRVDHTDPKFLSTLVREIRTRLGVRGRRGIIIRLHALGDFYSTDYVGFWDTMLAKNPRLVIYGYTAWEPDSEIGQAITALIDKWPGRAMMRFSNGGLKTRSAVSVKTVADCPPGAFVCPDQTGQFDGCGKCGACWTTLKNVAFADHD